MEITRQSLHIEHGLLVRVVAINPIDIEDNPDLWGRYINEEGEVINMEFSNRGHPDLERLRAIKLKFYQFGGETDWFYPEHDTLEEGSSYKKPDWEV